MMSIGFLATSTTAMSGEGVYNYGLVIVLMMTGLYLVLSKGNMIKSIIGLNLFQVSVIMFYVSMGRIEGGTAPILYPEDQGHHEAHDEHAAEHSQIDKTGSLALVSTAGDGRDTKDAHVKKDEHVTDADSHGHEEGVAEIRKGRQPYSNPLPHVLMLTAIVVGVATTALALSLVVRINEYYGTIEEDELEQEVLS